MVGLLVQIRETFMNTRASSNLVMKMHGQLRGSFQSRKRTHHVFEGTLNTHHRVAISRMVVHPRALYIETLALARMLLPESAVWVASASRQQFGSVLVQTIVVSVLVQSFVFNVLESLTIGAAPEESVQARVTLIRASADSITSARTLLFRLSEGIVVELAPHRRLKCRSRCLCYARGSLGAHQLVVGEEAAVLTTLRLRLRCLERQLG